MRQETIDKLCCPFDKGDLDLKIIARDIEDKIQEGYFTCKTCMRIYPIIKGIPIMTPDEYREEVLERPLMKHWQDHLEGREYEDFRLLPKAETEG